MRWGMKQKWTDGKNIRVSWHLSRDDIQPFAQEQYRGGMETWIVQKGSPEPVLMLGKDVKALEGKFGIWK